MTLHQINPRRPEPFRPLAGLPLQSSKPLAMGLLVGSRGFFPGHLAEQGRAQMIAAMEAEGLEVVIPEAAASKYGAIESRDEAKLCAALFREHRDRIAGIVVSLPNFGDERGVAETLRLAGLNIPILVQAFPDTTDQMGITHRRDAFCGKMSVCNVLRQYGLPFSLTSRHTDHPDSGTFRADLRAFAATCRVVKGLRSVRIGAIGARPGAFKTVRYSEKILEAAGIAVEPVDLSEVLGRVARTADDDPTVQAKLAAIHDYVTTAGIPAESLLRMAKLGAVIDGWMREEDVTVSAVQCWTAMEEYFGVVPCTIMSMMSNDLLPSACEVDVCGTLSMYALTLAAGSPSALLDWNNNYGDDPNKAVCFHCSNLPKHFFESAKMDYQEIIAGTVGRENTYGTIVGKVRQGPMTFARFSTDDLTGRIRGYVGDGRFTNDPLKTFGGAGVVEIPRLQELLRYICDQGFEHHVAGNFSTVADVLHEATTRYLGWDVLWHR
jgi:L-fucose isomerase-like protein